MGSTFNKYTSQLTNKPCDSQFTLYWKLSKSLLKKNGLTIVLTLFISTITMIHLICTLICIQSLFLNIIVIKPINHLPW